MTDKKKGYKQQNIKEFMVNHFKESQSSHDAQKSSDVSNGGTRSINDDKTRQDKKWKNENGDTVFIDPTLEEDEVEKKDDTHLGKRIKIKVRGKRSIRKVQSRFPWAPLRGYNH